jgi:hypothetical protein
MQTCILLSSCDKYVDLARLTVRLLDERWLSHPPIFLSGITPVLGLDCLPLVDDPRDWVGITASAVDALLARGYGACYVIIEDHPPFGVCNDVALNELLPGLMQKLNAAYIGLYGWDQRAESKGAVLGDDCFRLQRQAPDFPWRFSLHPGLWRLQAFRDVLRRLSPVPGDPASRSIWSFERRSGAHDFALPAGWNERTYRVAGLSLLGGARRRLRRHARLIEFRAYDTFRWVLLHTAGKSAVASFDARLRYRYYFFDGPYPMFWSGVMRKGALNSDMRRFLERCGRRSELRMFERSLGGRT